MNPVIRELNQGKIQTTRLLLEEDEGAVARPLEVLVLVNAGKANLDLLPQMINDFGINNNLLGILRTCNLLFHFLEQLDF